MRYNDSHYDERLTYATILLEYEPSYIAAFIPGRESPDEMRIMEILDHINERPGGGTVRILVTGLNGWTTDFRSILAMVSR
jgi:hypothetical protein